MSYTDSEILDLFGDTTAPGEGQSFTKIKNFRLEKGNNIYRIIPAFKSLKAKKQFYAYHRQHFGYKGVDRQDSTKTKARPFKCPLEVNHKTKKVIVPCPECTEIEAKLAMRNDRATALAAKGHSEDEVKVMLEQLDAWLEQHNVDKKYYLNVKTPDGEFGVLAIGYKAFKSLETELKQLQEMGVNAFAPNEGVWFNFVREGEGRYKTEYYVKVLQEQVNENGRKYMTYKPAPLSVDDLKKASEECADLPFVLRELTQQQIKMLVDSNNDPEEVDAIFNLATTREVSPSREGSPAFAELPPAKPVAKAQTAPAPKATPVEDEEQRLLRQLDELRNKRAVNQVVTPKVEEKVVPKVEATPTSTVNPREMTEDEFLAMYRDTNKA